MRVATARLEVLAVMMICLFSNPVANAQADVRFVNRGDEDIYLVEAVRSGFLWESKWKVRGRYKIPAGRSLVRPNLDDITCFGFLNGNGEGEVFRPDGTKGKIPEAVRKVRVNPKGPFEYVFGPNTPPPNDNDYADLQMSFVLEVWSTGLDLTGSAKANLTLELRPLKSVPGTPLLPTSKIEEAALATPAAPPLTREELFASGVRSYQEANFATAAKFFMEAAMRHDPEACYRLGAMFLEGVGVLQSDKSALHWFSEAASNHAAAQFAVGSMYSGGRGVEKDHAEAFLWYYKSAVRGNTDAQCAVAYAYKDGVGVEPSDSQAFKWFKTSAVKGNSASAQYGLGYMLDQGRGCDENDGAAIGWYQKAAHQNHVMAQLALAMMYLSDNGVGTNLSEGIGWARKAADQGESTAQYLLGNLYELGRGVPKDENVAIMWYRRAASQGEERAAIAVRRLAGQ